MLTPVPPYYSSALETCLLLAVLLPLASFVVSFCISERYSWIVTFLAPLLMLVSTISAAYVFFTLWKQEPLTIECNWFHVGDYSFSAGIYLDNVAVLMLLVVTLISFLVHVYSTGYMAGDGGIRRYFAMLGFFTFSMLGIVVVNNLLLVFAFWELVGFSSYMLIGHWKEKPEAATAARKAFIINRIGDAGFLIGMMILWASNGTFDIPALGHLSGNFSWQSAASLCIFCGVIGKSAQFPLLTWLPDAMEGPTPVSALIHAATMVAAGVFLLVRINFLFTPEVLDVVALVGIVTSVMAALSALVQTDMKKILAYSTISQLGLMVTAVGTGSPGAAMLHLFTHAFFKACLFLSAGTIIHVLHQAQQQSHTHFDVQDIRNLGGLRKKMPFTFLAFVISGSALAGLPFFTGFLSKDAILTSLMVWKGSEFSWRWLVFALAFAVSFMTALYTFRLVWTVFMGEEKSTRHLALPEPPVVMRGPVALLAIGSCWLFISWNPLDYQGWLFNALHPGKHFHFSLLAILSALWVAGAIAVGYGMRKKDIRSEVLLNNFYLDKVYDLIIVKPSLQVSLLTDKLDRKWIDGFIHATAYAQVSAAHLIGWFDRAIIDGSVNAMASLSRGLGNFTRSFQGGKIQLYIFWAILTIIIFLIRTLF